jgi:hypothetical protein
MATMVASRAGDAAAAAAAEERADRPFLGLGLGLDLGTDRPFLGPALTIFGDAPPCEAAGVPEGVHGESVWERTSRVLKWITDGVESGTAGARLSRAMSAWVLPLSSSGFMCGDNGKVHTSISNMAMAVGLPEFADAASVHGDTGEKLMLRTLPRVIENGSAEDITVMLDLLGGHKSLIDARATDAALLSAAVRGDRAVFSAVCEYMGGADVASGRFIEMLHSAQHSEEARWTVLIPAAEAIRMLMSDK